MLIVSNKRTSTQMCSMRITNHILGATISRALILHNSVINTGIDVMNTNMPLLADLEVLTQSKLFMKCIENLLCCPYLSLSLLLVGNRCHVCLACNIPINVSHNTKDQVQIHRNFFYTASDKLSNLPLYF